MPHRPRRIRPAFVSLLVGLAIALIGAATVALTLDRSLHGYFRITVLDEETNRGVPLVELKTLNHIRHFTDSNGVIAFYEPGLMDRDVFFYVESAGYAYPPDLFGARGLRLRPREGDSVTIRLRRINVAERLYRTTGAGIYRDSYLLGLPIPIRHPVLNAEVLGQDSILGTLYEGRIFWLWGDTHRASYPLGNFSVSGAMSALPGRGGLDPGVGVEYAYFVDSTGFSKKMIDLGAPGFVWFDWLATAPDAQGRERLLAKYARVGLWFENFDRGIALYEDEASSFTPLVQTPEWLDEYHVCHHPFRARIGEQEYYYFTSEFGFSRVERSMAAMTEPRNYASFTCLAAGSGYDVNDPKLDREANGRLVWDWKNDSDPITATRQKELIEAGKISREEAWLQLEDVETGAHLTLSRGSVFWNTFRQRWIMVASRAVGEVWYAEADTPVGPWVYARRVAKHDRTFYNPTQHPFFDQQGGRIVYFEGTYTRAFAPGDIVETPRYDYNQLMYRLDLDDPRVYLPAPVYRVRLRSGEEAFQFSETVAAAGDWPRIEEIAFFAYPTNRARPGLIPVFQRPSSGGPILTTKGHGAPAFFALPPTIDRRGQAVGRWRLTLTNVDFFRRDWAIDIALSDNVLTGGSDVGEVKIDRVGYADSLLTIHVRDDAYGFELTGKLDGADVAGEWKTLDGSVQGTWRGHRESPIWRPMYSPSVVALATLVEDGKTRYVTRPAAAESTETKGTDVLCSVWRNPYGLLILDPEPVAVMPSP